MAFYWLPWERRAVGHVSTSPQRTRLPVGTPSRVPAPGHHSNGYQSNNNHNSDIITYLRGVNNELCHKDSLDFIFLLLCNDLNLLGIKYNVSQH